MQEILSENTFRTLNSIYKWEIIPSSEKVLVKLDANWADEFDVECLWITTRSEYEAWLDRLRENFDPNREYYFGTNEYVTFDNYEEIVNNIEVETISEEFYNEFKEKIGEHYCLIDLSYLAE